MNGNLERDMYIGHDAQQMRGVLSLKHPMRNGIITNWDDMEKVNTVYWYNNILKINGLYGMYIFIFCRLVGKNFVQVGIMDH